MVPRFPYLGSTWPLEPVLTDFVYQTNWGYCHDPSIFLGDFLCHTERRQFQPKGKARYGFVCNPVLYCKQVDFHGSLCILQVWLKSEI
jgi:hypothetical protein